MPSKQDVQAREGEMRPKDVEYEQARELRRQGYSVREIAQLVDASKGSISVWVRDLVLTEEQISRLKDNRRRGREQTSVTKARLRADKISRWRAEADEEYAELKNDPLFMFGLGLYVGEGSKGDRPDIIFVNWNPVVFRAGLSFIRSLGAEVERMRFSVVLHPNQDAEAAVEFWSSYLGIDADKITRVTRTAVPGSRGKRGQKWPYGGCRLRFGSVVLKHKLLRWMELALLVDRGR